MIDVYDNGALMLGRVDKVIEEIEREIKEDLDMVFTDKNEVLEELKDYYKLDSNMIVCINYENPMGYTIDYWYSNDIIREKESGNYE